MADGGTKRRTQAQRRAASQQAVLDSAARLFGAKGYAATSLEEIADDCGLTIRPIYHYFGNKKALFAAVNAVMEERIVASIRTGGDGTDGADTVQNWRAFLDLCDDPGFRQVVLVDSPNILGRQRWSTSEVSEKARSALRQEDGEGPVQRYRQALINRVVMGAFTEAALMVAAAEDVPMAQDQAEKLMIALFSNLRGQLTVPER